MKIFFIAFALASSILVVSACEQSVKKIADTTDGLLQSDPDVDLSKKNIDAFGKADLETYRACLSDSEFFVNNEWIMDSTVYDVVADSMVAGHKKRTEVYCETINVNMPMYKAVVILPEINTVTYGQNGL